MLVWLEIFSSLRSTSSKTTHLVQVPYFIWPNTLKGTAKAPAVYLLRLNTLRDAKTASLTPERCNEHLHPFCMVVPVGALTLTLKVNRKNVAYVSQLYCNILSF